MNHHKYKEPPVSAIKFWVVLFGMIVACIFLLSGCMTPKKAVDYLKQKDLLDDTCSANFPVISTTDSTSFIKSKAEFDSLAGELEDQLRTARNESESLYDLISRLMADSTVECDSLVESVYRHAANETKKTSDLQKQVAALRASSKTIQPIILKERDRAFEEVLQDANVKIQQQLGATETKAAALEEKVAEQKDKIKTKNQKIFWLYIIIAALIVWTFRKPLARIIIPMRP
jgi:predicted RND superfamily exporter protein